jgi:hypothetical protein
MFPGSTGKATKYAELTLPEMKGCGGKYSLQQLSIEIWVPFLVLFRNASLKLSPVGNSTDEGMLTNGPASNTPTTLAAFRGSSYNQHCHPPFELRKLQFPLLNIVGHILN